MTMVQFGYGKIQKFVYNQNQNVTEITGLRSI